MQHQAREIRYFFYSQAFADGFRTTFAILLPALLGLYFNFFQIGLTISLGCMSVSLTDAPGPVIHKRNGMLFCSAFIFIVSILTGFARLNIYTLGLEIIADEFFLFHVQCLRNPCRVRWQFRDTDHDPYNGFFAYAFAGITSRVIDPWRAASFILC